MNAGTEAAIGRAVDRLSPGGAGWWHRSTADTLAEFLAGLVELGVPLGRATELTAGLIGAIQNEYGD